MNDIPIVIFRKLMNARLAMRCTLIGFSLTAIVGLLVFSRNIATSIRADVTTPSTRIQDFALAVDKPLTEIVDGRKKTKITYKIKNTSYNDTLAFSVSYSPHAYAKIHAFEGNEMLSLRPRLSRFGSAGKTYYLQPSQEYTATFVLEDMFNLTLINKDDYKVYASMSGAVLNTGTYEFKHDVELTSNVVTIPKK